MNTAAAEVVREFWRLMGTNDFHAVGAVLANNFILDWPQSNERIRGRERFATMNDEFPAMGRWVFAVYRIVGAEVEAVTDVTVTDGSRHDRAISFFTVRDGKITRIVEYWPEPHAAPANRSHLCGADRMSSSNKAAILASPPAPRRQCRPTRRSSGRDRRAPSAPVWRGATKLVP